MAPIYDTDIAQQRWEQADWEHYELWEKVEHRLRRHKRMWIAATAAVFVALSSIPIIMDRSPKWTSLAATRRLAQEFNGLKYDAGRDKAAYRIRFAEGGALSYRIEKSSSCSEPQGTLVREGVLVPEAKLGGFALLDKAQGQELGVPGLMREVCYDYLAGADPILRGDAVAGFGVIPARDLGERRADRMSLLLLSGPSGEVSFE